ncbi:LptA/OstA family protein [Stakelama tenebrarum]|uniref:OstA family protein n=1 Tax=Stakelama tenebrarum TaxID=2711215 RepID=A0A6G6Y0I9_9SPHN|nr:LptA/OstA family protein [Sphingosinithalassobacter tenebrarum]QIG78435.1 OstA family protein [Sphingosinithalassobacter tenebrarum]
MNRALPLLPLLLALASCMPADAQTRHDTDAPIDFNAQNIQLDDRANRVVLSGDVQIRQAEMALNAARVTVSYSGNVLDGVPQANRLDASGGVTFSRPDQRARAQYAVYDINRRVVTMIGGVTLRQGGNTVQGGRLSIDLDTGRATIDGSGVGGTSGENGRVSGRFSVPGRDDE